MKSREYQVDFYLSSSAVKDHESRRAKARKILYALQRYSDVQLSASTCLDVGCSSGLITAALASHFKRIVGVEYDQLALQATPEHIPPALTFVRGDAMALPCRDNSIDVIICAQVYEHVPDDKLLFEEIYRVLRPGGVVFFSGPNWLYPIEPHYFLPFLHWLPQPIADLYLRLTHKGDHYYEKSRALWGLRRLMRRFEITDISLEVLEYSLRSRSPLIVRLLRVIPEVIWKLFLPLLPNYNWLLRKPKVHGAEAASS